jgi:hypothetical protein
MLPYLVAGFEVEKEVEGEGAADFELAPIVIELFWGDGKYEGLKPSLGIRDKLPRESNEVELVVLDGMVECGDEEGEEEGGSSASDSAKREMSSWTCSMIGQISLTLCLAFRIGIGYLNRCLRMRKHSPVFLNLFISPGCENRAQGRRLRAA